MEKKLLVLAAALAGVSGAGTCVTRVDTLGVAEADGNPKHFDPQNAGLMALTGVDVGVVDKSTYLAKGGDKCEGSVDDYLECAEELPLGSGKWMVPAGTTLAKGKCCKLSTKADTAMCDASPKTYDDGLLQLNANDPAGEDNIYHIGKCNAKWDGSQMVADTEGGISPDGAYIKNKATANCGPVHVIDFGTNGKMILEFNPGEEPCAGGMFLPFFPGEFMWSITAHTIIFFITLFWSFLGIAIIADIFMAAIEVITSKTKTIVQTNPDGTEKKIEFLVWNETVANLTLMALGSSAPEILLSVIETLGLTNAEAVPGGLGPGTIVGSAAFNLLVIIAICIMAIPKPDTETGETGVRKIKATGVFNCTAFFSVFAYIWLFICVMDNNVTLVEAWITFLFFPLLVGLSYYLDKKGAKGDAVVPDDISDGSGGEQHVAGTTGMGARNYGAQELAKKLATLKAAAGLSGLIAEQQNNVDKKEIAAQKKKIAALAVSEIQSEQKVSIMQAKINARRGMSGGRRVVAGEGDKEALAALKKIAEQKQGELRAETERLAGTNTTLIAFASAKYSVDENKGKIAVQVLRGGNCDSEICVYYNTMDGEAVAGSDYKFSRGHLTFKKGETVQTITIDLIDDSDYEPDETFFIELHQPKSGKKGTPSEPFEFNSKFGPQITSVVILNDDKPGTFSFEKPSYSVSEANKKFKMKIERTSGADGEVQVQVKTVDGSAKAGGDYVKFDQVVAFKDGQSEAGIEIELIEDDAYEKEESFTVELTLLSEGCARGEHMRSVVTICGDEAYAQLVDEVAALMALQFESLSLETTTWAEQFNTAMNIEGEEGQSPAVMDYVMHFLTFGWKIMFATVPPTSYYGGWLTFFVALGYIGVLTAFVADIAGIFGCLLGLDDAITAISFVALGTSLPDTFASKAAAVNDKTADASVGNVTGSNSVNVFLGLGLPWVLATGINMGAGFTPLNTKGNLGDYPMIAGSLGFSVVVFCICACTCIGLLYLRRAVFGYELGGAAASASGAFCIFLWFTYVALSSLEIKGVITSFI